MTFRSRSLASAVAVAALTLTLGACGADDTPDPSADPTQQVTSTPSETATVEPTPTPTPTPESTVIELTIGDAQPGRREKVEIGEKIIFRITADEAGELHIHSSPEQEVAFPAGTSDVTVVIDQPGIVDVEDHGTDALLVQLEVR